MVLLSVSWTPFQLSGHSKELPAYTRELLIIMPIVQEKPFEDLE